MMESLRLREKNIALLRIKEIQTYIKRNEETISRFKKLNNQSSFELKQIEKLTSANKNFETEIIDLNKKVTDIVSGNLDNELGKIITASNKNKVKDDEKQKNKMIEKYKKDKKDKVLISQSFKINGNRNDEYYMQKEYDRFLKICNSIPDYILRNLKEMPSNKGYIWKGVWCFGELPEEKTGQLIMFEKLYNGILKIYEIDDNYRRIYEKKGKDRKILISEEPRSDFIKDYRKSKNFKLL